MAWLLSRKIDFQRLLQINHGKALSDVPKEHTVADEAKGPSATSHRVNNLEKRFLVWTKKYKSIEEVPAYVPQNVMERTRNRMRIRIANYMMAATVIGCLAMVYLGKEDKARGESVAQRNLDWHRKYNEEQDRKEAEAQAQKQ